MAAIREILNSVLLFFDSVTGNYGISIILLTILVRLITWPLTNKQLSSAKAMQELQPEVKRLQEKYKNDKEKLNAETMELWKRNKVNPFTGCLPLLIQMPILFAMFRVLQDPPAGVENFMLFGIDMRISVNMLWEQGLAFDIKSFGYYLLVVLSGATTWLQQKMMMTDKTQQLMMIMMPLMLLYFSLQFPAGLVLYWVFNNLLSIAHHALLNKKSAKGAVTE